MTEGCSCWPPQRDKNWRFKTNKGLIRNQNRRRTLFSTSSLPTAPSIGQVKRSISKGSACWQTPIRTNMQLSQNATSQSNFAISMEKKSNVCNCDQMHLAHLVVASLRLATEGRAACKSLLTMGVPVRRQSVSRSTNARNSWSRWSLPKNRPSSTMK